MADRSSDDLSRTTPPLEEDKHLPSMPPERDTTSEEVQNREQIEDDQEMDDRFQATDN